MNTNMVSMIDKLSDKAAPALVIEVCEANNIEVMLDWDTVHVVTYRAVEGRQYRFLTDTAHWTVERLFEFVGY